MKNQYMPMRVLQGSDDMQTSGANNMRNFLLLILIFVASVFFFLTISRLIKAYFICNHAGNFEAARWHQHDFLFGHGRQGLDPSAIASIPTYTYQRDIKNGIGSSGRWAQCAICLSFMEEGGTVRQLPECRHLFHVECIDKWLNSHATCPLCRSLISYQIAGVGARIDLEGQASTSGIGARVEGT